MGSIDAERVAQEVSESIRDNKKIILGKIIRKKGYAKSTSEAPQRVTNTKSYQRVISPIVNKWIKERDRLTKALSEKDLSKENMRDTIDAIDKLTKNIQLVSGGATENLNIVSGVEIHVRD